MGSLSRAQRDCVVPSVRTRKGGKACNSRSVSLSYAVRFKWRRRDEVRPAERGRCPAKAQTTSPSGSRFSGSTERLSSLFTSTTWSRNDSFQTGSLSISGRANDCRHEHPSAGRCSLLRQADQGLRHLPYDETASRVIHVRCGDQVIGAALNHDEVGFQRKSVSLETTRHLRQRFASYPSVDDFAAIVPG
jgi:hypothetical protein